MIVLGTSLLAVLLGGAPPPAAAPGGPSRAAIAGCAWEKLSDPALGLEAWVQRCSFDSRKVDFFTKDHSLFIRYSDGGDPYATVDVLELLPNEAVEAGVRRWFDQHTDKAVASRCVMAPYRGGRTPSGVQRFTFLPDAAYKKELDAKADPNDVPDPPCGDWGDAPDGIQYFEAQPGSGARKVLFVRIGQDEPLFDEQTLRLLPKH